MAVTDDRLSVRARWADAVAVLAVVVAVILGARQLRPLAAAGAFLARTGEMVVAVPASTWVRAAVWAAISGAVLLRWRIAAVLGAWAAVSYEIVVAALRINGGRRYGLPLDLLAWPLLLAVTAALLLSVSTPVRHGLDLLGRRGRWLLAGAATVTTLTATAIPLLGEYHRPPPEDSIDPGFNIVFSVASRLASAVAGVTFTVVLILVVATVSWLDRSVRARVYTLIATGAAVFTGIQSGLPLPFGMSTVPALSRPAQAVLLVVGPCLVFGAGLLLIRFSRRPAFQTWSG
ncbi:hypothetical protein [Dactylosporangium sp. NPDC051484]|uniref:hypothetical protein n=1 Tax=Dactylosporangium sp. NPDC051484 TaxID=3154942 RepID=UPI003450BBC4